MGEDVSPILAQRAVARRFSRQVRNADPRIPIRLLSTGRRRRRLREALAAGESAVPTCLEAGLRAAVERRDGAHFSDRRPQRRKPSTTRRGVRPRRAAASRGRMVAINQFNIVLGLSAAYFVNYFLIQAMNNDAAQRQRVPKSGAHLDVS